MRSVKPHQLRLVFADSPQGSVDEEPSGVPEGKAHLLHIASARKVKGFTATGATRSLTASGQSRLPGQRYQPEEPDVRPTSPVL